MDAPSPGPFDTDADRYDALRPGYPDEAIGWLLESPSDVADVGAGTGKLTAALLAAGHRVVAVEPSEPMLATLAALHPEARRVRATGERTGLPDACVDAVCYGQSWHWTDHAAAAVEALRLLRPGGTLAMLWNDADTEVDWVARYQLAQRGLKQRRAVTRRLPRFLHPDLQPREEHVVAWTRPISKRDLRDLVTTFSYWRTASDEAKRRRLDAVSEQLDADWPGPDDREIPYPLLTRLTRYRLTARAGLAKQGLPPARRKHRSSPDA
ncbi:class I SAM-dependent methyltransferase [Nigerium massiliense]|uniref:class I SAM-dependent methyltransferase n=1 Tax=Nigerium massiliense TaxID=1522317 RepID=UPI000694391B|nr:class I SAM-dependent methyltransferase [Nigerium massiliense]